MQAAREKSAEALARAEKAWQWARNSGISIAVIVLAQSLLGLVREELETTLLIVPVVFIAFLVMLLIPFLLWMQVWSLVHGVLYYQAPPGRRAVLAVVSCWIGVCIWWMVAPASAS